MADKVFADGMFIKERDDRTPDFVLGKFSFKADQFIALLQQYKNSAGYVNIDLKKAQNGKKYFEVNTYGLDVQAAPAPQAAAQSYVAQNPPAPFNDQF